MIITFCLHLQGDAQTIQIEAPPPEINKLGYIQEQCLKHHCRNMRGNSSYIGVEDVILLLIHE